MLLVPYNRLAHNNKINRVITTYFKNPTRTRLTMSNVIKESAKKTTAVDSQHSTQSDVYVPQHIHLADGSVECSSLRWSSNVKSPTSRRDSSALFWSKMLLNASSDDQSRRKLVSYDTKRAKMLDQDAAVQPANAKSRTKMSIAQRMKGVLKNLSNTKNRKPSQWCTRRFEKYNIQEKRIKMTLTTFFVLFLEQRAIRVLRALSSLD